MDEAQIQAKALDASQTCAGELFLDFQYLPAETRSEVNRRIR
jgi:hypothetical protein